MYLVIEVKCHDVGYKQDLQKLLAYKRELGYTYAVFLRLPTGEEFAEPRVEWQ